MITPDNFYIKALLLALDFSLSRIENENTEFETRYYIKGDLLVEYDHYENITLFEADVEIRTIRGCDEFFNLPPTYYLEVMQMFIGMVRQKKIELFLSNSEQTFSSIYHRHVEAIEKNIKDNMISFEIGEGEDDLPF